MHQAEGYGCRVSRAGLVNGRTTRQAILSPSGTHKIHGTCGANIMVRATDCTSALRLQYIPLARSIAKILVPRQGRVVRARNCWKLFKTSRLHCLHSTR